MGDPAVKVLCVEDDPDMMFLVRMILQLPEWSLIEAVDGPSAIAGAEACAPDIALLDYMLPGMDGLLLAQELRSRAPHCPLVLFSAHPTAGQKAADHPALDAFVSKTDVTGVQEVLRGLLADRVSV